MRRTLLGLLTTLAIVGGSALVAAPAEAAAKPVRITNSTNAWVGWDGKATITPKFSKAKRVTIKKKVLTVKQGGKVIAKNRTKVTLRAGTYRVAVKVTYKYKGKTRTAAKSLTVKAKQGKCATNADVASVKLADLEAATINGDSLATVQKKLHSTGVVTERMTLREMLESELEDAAEYPEDYDAEEIAEIQAMLDTLSEEELNSDVIQVRGFASCGQPKKPVTAYFVFDSGTSAVVFLLSPDDPFYAYL